jgi:hypothetical protein
MRFMTDKEKEIVIAAFTDLDDLIQQYRQAVLWITLGNHDENQRSTKQATWQRMKELEEKITTLLANITSKTQSN